MIHILTVLVTLHVIGKHGKLPVLFFQPVLKTLVVNNVANRIHFQ